MDMTVIVAMSSVSVAACLVTVSRVVGWKRILANATAVDVGFTVVLAVFMGGTLNGNLVAILGGLLMALVLTGLKHINKLVDTKPKDDPASEFTASGEWKYNQAPYI